MVIERDRTITTSIDPAAQPLRTDFR